MIIEIAGTTIRRMEPVKIQKRPKLFLSTTPRSTFTLGNARIGGKVRSRIQLQQHLIEQTGDILAVRPNDPNPGEDSLDGLNESRIRRCIRLDGVTQSLNGRILPDQALVAPRHLIQFTVVHTDGSRSNRRN
jgi:hypothetical protein